MKDEILRPFSSPVRHTAVAAEDTSLSHGGLTLCMMRLGAVSKIPEGFGQFAGITHYKCDAS